MIGARLTEGGFLMQALRERHEGPMMPWWLIGNDLIEILVS